MKYKFIASDFDGTLLRSDDKLSKRNVEAINRYFEAGGIFAVSTGRTFDSLMQRMSELELPEGVDYPVITFQGSVISGYPSKVHRNIITIDNETIIKAVECVREADAYCHLYTIDKLLIREKCELSELYCSFNRLNNAAMYVGDLVEYVKTHNPQVLKIVYMDKAEKVAAVGKLLEKRLPGLLITSMVESRFMESVSPLSGKGSAVLRVAKEFNIAPHEVIAIGDSMNDFTMIRDAGLGVAVKNAAQQLKDAADLIAPYTNDEDAVAWVIEQAIKGVL